MQIAPMHPVLHIAACAPQQFACRSSTDPAVAACTQAMTEPDKVSCESEIRHNLVVLYLCSDSPRVLIRQLFKIDPLVQIHIEPAKWIDMKIKEW